MRTKSLLAAAALIAAGVLSSQAQSNVYSLNVVGYVNLNLKPGYNLITAQLKDVSGSTGVNVLLTNAPGLVDGSTLFAWDNNLQDFGQSVNWVSPSSGGPLWVGADFETPSTDTVPRGTAFFIYNNGAAATLTLVGEVPQGVNSSPGNVPANYAFVADFVPASQEIATNGFPIADSSTLTTFDADAQDYTQSLNGISAGSGGPIWVGADFETPVAFAPAVGQGFLYSAAGSATWTRSFTVQ